MQKTRKHIREIAERVLFAGFCVQICIGMLWMVLRFCGSLAASESLFSMGKNEFAPHAWCLLQLLIAGFSSYHLLKTLGIHSKKWLICGVLGLLTFPMAAQCHLSFGRDSIVSSLLLLLFSASVRCIRGGKERTRVQLGVILLTAALLAGIGVSGVNVTRAPMAEAGAAGESKTWYTVAQERFETSMVSRFAWSSLQTLYGTWPEEIKKAVPEQVVRETSYYADNVERVLFPWLQQTYGTGEQGRAQTAAVLRSITRIAQENNTKGICREILWDAAGYGFSPIVVQLQLAGRGYDSYTGILYDNLGQHTPRLSYIYMTYGCRFFGMALLLGIILRCIGMEDCTNGGEGSTQGGERSTQGGEGSTQGNVSRKKNRKIFWGTFLFGLLFAGALIAFYTLRGAAMMDYRKTIVLVLLQLAWMLSSAERSGDAGISNTDIGN